MIKREYYSIRTGNISTEQEANFEYLRKSFMIAYKKIRAERYFVKYLGELPDRDYCRAELGDVKGGLYVNLRKENLYPIEEYINDYSEEDLFDIIEFLHDNCSKEGSELLYFEQERKYSYDYDDIAGRKYFRELLNPILGKYSQGFELSEDGQILILADNGLSTLLEAEIPTNDDENIKKKVNSAVLKFRGYRSTLEDRRNAIRELADVLEFLRPQVKQFDRENENDIFNIANKFGIRHHNSIQKTDYDKPIWYSWIFYYYLATIHAVLRMKE